MKSGRIPRIAGICLAVVASALTGGCSPPDRELSDAQLYEKYCSDCHGDRGQGAERFRDTEVEADLLASQMVIAGRRGEVRRRIAYGGGPMPGYVHRLAKEDLERLVDFVLTLPQTGKPGDRREGGDAVDPKRLKNAYTKLQSLDERLTYKVRPPRSGTLSRTGGRATSEMMEEKLRDVSHYTVELKEIVEELIMAFAIERKSAPKTQPGTDSPDAAGSSR